MSQSSACPTSHETLSLPAGSTYPPGRPSQAPVHAVGVDHHSTDYTHYSGQFSESTAYDNSATTLALAAPQSSSSSSSSSSPSSLARTSSTRQIETFGSKFLSAITDSVKAPPAVTAPSRTKTLHQRARSLASFVSSLSPAAVEEQKGSSTNKARHSTPLFGANSARRHSIALIQEEPEEEIDYSNPIMEYKSTLTGGNRPSRSPSSAPRPGLPSRSSLTQTSSRKFNWFGASKQQPAPAEPQLDPATSDFLQPASALLFTHRSPDPQDPTASFADLLKTAEALITRLQTAYKQQETELKTARQEREAAAEEAEEADTRARHLKLQLDEMGKNANEQVSVLKSMTDELALEKLRRAEDNERMENLHGRPPAQDDATPTRAYCRDSTRSSGSSNSMFSMASDSGFESDCYAETETDATADSIASRPMTPLYEQQRWDAPVKDAKRPDSRGSSMQDRTCHVDIEVWRYMREQKGQLEKRVRELEGVLDGCLDLVS